MRREVSIAFQTDKTAARYVALAHLVDQYDFDCVSAYCDTPYHPAFAALLLMAPHIKRARVGVAALPPTRVHPIDIAAQAALLSELAAGGIYIGMARGAWLTDHGISEPEQPVQTLREAVEVVRYMLSGATGGYRGQVYQLAEHVRAPYPVPDELPPILIGTWGRKLCALAGEIADEVKIGGSTNPAVIPVIAGYTADGERKIGRKPETVRVVIWAVTVVDEDREAARMAARRSVALYLPVVAPLDPTLTIDPELVTRLENHVHRNEFNSAAHLISDELLDCFAFAGNGDDLIRQSEALFAAGASRVEFGTPHGLIPEQGIHILGKRVIRALQR